MIVLHANFTDEKQRKIKKKIKKLNKKVPIQSSLVMIHYYDTNMIIAKSKSFK